MSRTAPRPAFRQQAPPCSAESRGAGRRPPLRTIRLAYPRVLGRADAGAGGARGTHRRHPDYRPARLREWLHGGAPFEDWRRGPRPSPWTPAPAVAAGDARAARGLSARSGVAARVRAASFGRARGQVGRAGQPHAGHARPRVRHRLARVPAELHRREAAVRGRARGHPRRRRAACARGCRTACMPSATRRAGSRPGM